MNRYQPRQPLLRAAPAACRTSAQDELSRPLRRIYVALLLGKGIRHKGCPPKLMQELLGHASIAITLDTWTSIHTTRVPRIEDQTAAMESVSS